MTEKVIKFGIIGTGEAAGTHLAPALRLVPNALLWSVVSRNLHRGAEFAAAHGACGRVVSHLTVESMLRDTDVDAVIVASPDVLHMRQAVAAARAGKHVFIEKPMCTDVTEAAQIISACERSNVKLGVAYHHRHHNGHKAVRRMITEGVFAPIHELHVHWSRPSQMQLRPGEQWRADGDAGKWWSLAALGTHGIDLALYWLHGPKAFGEVEEIRALTSSTRFGAPRDETATVLLQFTGGVIARVTSSVALARRKRIELFYGDGKVLICEDTFGPTGEGSITMDGRPLAFEPVNPYVAELTDFVEAIRNDTEPLADGYAGLDNVTLLCAAQSDAERNK